LNVTNYVVFEFSVTGYIISTHMSMKTLRMHFF